MLYRHLCQCKIQYLYNLEFCFLLFCQGYMQQNEAHEFLIYRGRDLLHYLNGELNLGLCSRSLCYREQRNRKGRTVFMYLFVCFKNFSRKISITNLHHFFLISSNVFTHQLHLMVTFLNLLLSFLLRFYENCHSHVFEEMLLCELIRSQLCQIWLVH